MPFTPGQPLTTEEFALLTQRAGLQLSPDLIEHLKPVFERYREQLELLHSLQLADRDPAVTFSPTQGY